jgi:hypothetical protein
MDRTLLYHGTNRLVTTRLPTATELNRIRHTIEILKKSEDQLQERKNQKYPSIESEMIQKENRHHAFEIAAGWKQLGRMIEDIPDSFIDKAHFAEEVEDGLERSNLLIDRTWISIAIQR